MLNQEQWSQQVAVFLINNSKVGAARPLDNKPNDCSVRRQSSSVKKRAKRRCFNIAHSKANCSSRGRPIPFVSRPTGFKNGFPGNQDTHYVYSFETGLTRPSSQILFPQRNERSNTRRKVDNIHLHHPTREMIRSERSSTGVCWNNIIIVQR